MYVWGGSTLLVRMVINRTLELVVFKCEWLCTVLSVISFEIQILAIHKFYKGSLDYIMELCYKY